MSYMETGHDEQGDFNVVNGEGHVVGSVYWINEEAGYIGQWINGKVRAVKGLFRLVAKDGSGRKPRY
jgi:hypothetical protein